MNTDIKLELFTLWDLQNSGTFNTSFIQFLDHLSNLSTDLQILQFSVSFYEPCTS